MTETRRETGARSPEDQDVLVQYVEGPTGEPAGRRLVGTADRGLQQKGS